MLKDQTIARRMDRARSGRGRGFTLIELLIIVGFIGIMAVVVVPSFIEMLWRSKVESAARQTTIQMRAARFQAIQEAQEFGVWADFVNNRIVLFQGTEPPPPEGVGVEVRSFLLPGGIVFQGPEDGVTNGPFAIVMQPPADTSNENANGGWFVFDATGASDAAGQIRFAMPERSLYYRSEVDPRTTGTISQCKYRTSDSSWLC